MNAKRSTMDCILRKMYETGTGIDVIHAVDIPGRFKLHILADDLDRTYRVKARGERRVEVDFE